MMLGGDVGDLGWNDFAIIANFGYLISTDYYSNTNTDINTFSFILRIILQRTPCRYPVTIPVLSTFVRSHSNSPQADKPKMIPKSQLLHQLPLNIFPIVSQVCKEVTWWLGRPATQVTLPLPFVSIPRIRWIIRPVNNSKHKISASSDGINTSGEVQVSGGVIYGVTSMRCWFRIDGPNETYRQSRQRREIYQRVKTSF